MKYSYGKKGFGDQLKIEELIRIPGIGVIFPPILAMVIFQKWNSIIHLIKMLPLEFGFARLQF